MKISLKELKILIENYLFEAEDEDDAAYDEEEDDYSEESEDEEDEESEDSKDEESEDEEDEESEDSKDEESEEEEESEDEEDEESEDSKDLDKTKENATSAVEKQPDVVSAFNELVDQIKIISGKIRTPSNLISFFDGKKEIDKNDVEVFRKDRNKIIGMNREKARLSGIKLV